MDFRNTFKISTESISADGQFLSFELGMRLLNAALSIWFGFDFGGDIFPTGHPALSGVLGGIMFFVILDGAAYGWDAASKRDKISPVQRVIADKMSRAAMIASTVVSAVQVLLNIRLLDLSGASMAIGLAAAGLIVGMVAAHFIRLFAYRRASPAAVRSRAEAIIQSELAQMKLNHDAKLAYRMAERMQEHMTQHLDAHAKIQAAAAWEKYLVDNGFGARPQVPGEDKETGAPLPPADISVDDHAAAEVAHAETEAATLEWEDLKGKSAAGLADRVSLAGA